MNTIQVAATNPGIYVRKKYQPHHFLATPLGLAMNANPLSRTFLILRAKPSSCVQHVPVLKSRKPLHVCFAGGKGMMDSNEDSQRKSLEEAMKSFKGQSMEDILQKQIQKGEYYGGNGSKPPGGRGGGGGGDAGGSEDGGFAGMSDETLQIVFATIGFISVYIYVINGVELTKLARDFIKYLLDGTQSVRLKRATHKWVRFYKKITGSKEGDENGLEKAPTQWNITDYYRDFLRNYMKRNSDDYFKDTLGPKLRRLCLM